jgi:hypothetical protein
MTFVCEEEGAKPKNALNVDTVAFEGIIGDYVRIEANTKDILTICDTSITVKTLDPNKIQEINDNLGVCDNYYAECREQFADDL